MDDQRELQQFTADHHHYDLETQANLLLSLGSESLIRCAILAGLDAMGKQQRQYERIKRQAEERKRLARDPVTGFVKVGMSKRMKKATEELYRQVCGKQTD